ncbi:MAG: hypothetical protein H7039_19655 [Bryobacteraceae bacterium]|nr:hypothetical protein [Bryobacteraceae bacterium]
MRTLSMTSDEYPPIWAMDSTTPVSLTFSSVQPSAPYRLTRSNPIRVFQGALDDKGKPQDVESNAIRLPEASGILLLSWFQTGKPKFLAIQDTPESGRYNDWFLINSTAKSVAIQVGQATKPVVIQPGSQQILKIDCPADQGAATTLAYKEEDTWRKFFSTYLPVHKDQRCMIVLVQTGEKIQVKQIFENLDRNSKVSTP